MKPPYAIGSVPSLSGHAIAYRWRSLPRVRRHWASKPQGSSERVLPWQVTMDQLIFASLSHTHYWYEMEHSKARENLHTVRVARKRLEAHTASDTSSASHTSTQHTSSGIGKREAHKNWSMVIPAKEASLTGTTTLRITGPVTADSRQ